MRLPIRTTRLLCTAAATAVVGTATAFGAAGPAGAHQGHGHDGHGRDVPQSLLAEIRGATAQFHNPRKAEEAGYRRTEDCVPGMGQHWINPGLTNGFDLTGPVDAKQPHVLIYAPRSDGGVKLVAVEWLVADEDGDLSTHNDRPYLDGVPFDGPMPGHGPDMGVHYDLHLWVWQHNKAGVGEPFNPAVVC